MGISRGISIQNSKAQYTLDTWSFVRMYVKYHIINMSTIKDTNQTCERGEVQMDKWFSESFCFQQQKMHGQGLTVSPIDFSGGCNCHGPFLNEFMVHGKHAEFKVFPVLIHKAIFQENPTFLIGPHAELHRCFSNFRHPKPLVFPLSMTGPPF